MNDYEYIHEKEIVALKSSNPYDEVNKAQLSGIYNAYAKGLSENLVNLVLKI